MYILSVCSLVSVNYTSKAFNKVSTVNSSVGGSPGQAMFIVIYPEALDTPSLPHLLLCFWVQTDKGDTPEGVTMSYHLMLICRARRLEFQW